MADAEKEKPPVNTDPKSEGRMLIGEGRGSREEGKQIAET
jgi:hypothetical protein